LVYIRLCEDVSETVNPYDQETECESNGKDWDNKDSHISDDDDRSSLQNSNRNLDIVVHAHNHTEEECGTTKEDI
jgi:hypothetical protein